MSTTRRKAGEAFSPQLEQRRKNDIMPLAGMPFFAQMACIGGF
jgi:hypothetical protein